MVIDILIDYLFLHKKSFEAKIASTSNWGRSNGGSLRSEPRDLLFVAPLNRFHIVSEALYNIHFQCYHSFTRSHFPGEHSHTIHVIILPTMQVSKWKTLNTRMHSSGMRTARLLTLSQHALWPGGVPAWGVYLAGGVYLARGVYLPGGYLPRYSPPSGQTDTCKNITFANFVCGR